jgi:hypothetical protein
MRGAAAGEAGGPMGPGRAGGWTAVDWVVVDAVDWLPAVPDRREKIRNRLAVRMVRNLHGDSWKPPQFNYKILPCVVPDIGSNYKYKQ